MSGKKVAKKAAVPKKAGKGFTEDERAAMKERARELKAEAKGADGERELLAKVAEMSQPDRGMAEKVHAIIRKNAPQLSSKTWYGMPAWAKGDKVVCFFQAAAKFKARYATLGFSDVATLDDGAMWPTSYALTKLGPAEEKQIVALVKKAAGG